MQLLKSTLFLIFISLAFLAQGQDYIYKKDGEIIKSKVIEVSANWVKYHIYGEEDGPVYAEEKKLLTKIVYENGEVKDLTIEDSSFLKDDENSSYYAEQNKFNLKVGVLTLFYNHLDINLERHINKEISIEGGVQLIGTGIQTLHNRNASGYGLNIGVKFKSSPIEDIRRGNYAHILKGTYFKPQIIQNVFDEQVNTYDENNFLTSYTHETKAYALMINLGKQWVFSDRFSIDAYVGIGYADSNSPNLKSPEFDFPFGESNSIDAETSSSTQYGYITYSYSSQIAFAAGISVGYLF